MSYFLIQDFGFYLQDYYVKDWIDNSMVFLEIKDLPRIYQEFIAMNLPAEYPTVRVSDIQKNDWVEVFFEHDPMYFGRLDGLIEILLQAPRSKFQI